MNIDCKMHTLPGELHVRALSNPDGDVAVSILYHYKDHAERQAARARMETMAVGPVMGPWTAVNIGLRLILAAVICGFRKLFFLW